MAKKESKIRPGYRLHLTLEIDSDETSLLAEIYTEGEWPVATLYLTPVRRLKQAMKTVLDWLGKQDVLEPAGSAT